jgi:predicted methyltransferase
MRTVLMATVLGLAMSGIVPLPGFAQPSATAGAESIAAAVADPGRPEKDRARDAARKPAELVAFAGVKSGDVVDDLVPGSGYWSRIFSKVVGPNGKVFAFVPAELAGFKSDPVGTAKAMAAEPGRSNVTVVTHPLVPESGPTDFFDVVWTFQNYHDFHDSFFHGADVEAFDKLIYKALKPGGVFVIVDHAAEAGSGLKHTEDQHRIDPAQVRVELEKAGFKFDGESKVLANPADPHTALVFDPSIRGKTDQFAYRFKKPA